MTPFGMSDKVFILLLFCCGCDMIGSNHSSHNNTQCYCDSICPVASGRCVEYYENGNIKSIQYRSDSLLDGIFELYYPEGNLKQRSSWIKGEANGQAVHFYENGMIKAKDFWIDNRRSGLVEAYYKDGAKRFNSFYVDGKKNGKEIEYHPNGYVAAEREWITIDTLTFTNYEITYDTLGDTIESSHYVVVDHKNTVHLGQRVRAEFQLKNPVHKRSYIITYRNKHQNNNSAIDTIYMKNHVATVYFEANKIGWNTHKGIVRDYTEVRNKKGGKNTTYQDFYFTVKFFVKDSASEIRS